MLRPIFALLAALALAGPALADDAGNFIVMLGQDTVSVEHYTRTPARIEVDQVGRAPRTLRRHFTYDFDKGVLTKLEMIVTPPGSETPTQIVKGRADADSIYLTIQVGTAPPRNLNRAMPKGTLAVASSSPWSQYEAMIAGFVKGKPDSLRGTMYFIGADNTDWLSLRKIGRDSVSVMNGHMDVFHAAVDKMGHIVGVLPVAGTQKFSVSRVPSLDLASFANSWAARDKEGASMGMLSPRDSVKVTAGGASLWIDYGRPSKRGRVVYGGVVPYGEVWRTGANAATQFRTDKALDFGGVEVPAGFYTLWTLPTAGGWKLIVNGETGQWGTAHKAEKDLYTIDMKVSTLPQVVEHFTIGVETSADGGVLNLDWDTTRASAAFTVKP